MATVSGTDRQKEGKNTTSFGGQILDRPSDDYVVKVGAESDVRTGNSGNSTSEYNAAAYSFGLSSFPERCRPKQIYYAENEQDVVHVVKLACERGVGLAVRTGGHQYGGFCSTTGENLQLDVRDAFKYKSYDADLDVISLGVSWDLDIVDAWMRELTRKKDGAKGCFIPHVECGNVHAGGHMQSGGLSAMIPRSFGYFADHILQFTLICPPLERGGDPIKRTVTKPKTDPRSLTPREDLPAASASSAT